MCNWTKQLLENVLPIARFNIFSPLSFICSEPHYWCKLWTNICRNLCLKDSLCTERWMSLAFFVSNATAIARPLLFCVFEIVLESELWTPFFALFLCSEDGDGFPCSVCGSSVYAAFRLSRWCRLHPVIFPAAVSKNLHQWVKSSRSNTLVSCFAE